MRENTEQNDSEHGHFLGSSITVQYFSGPNIFKSGNIGRTMLIKIVR